MANDEGNNRIGRTPVRGAPCTLCQRPLTLVSYGKTVVNHVVTCVDCDKVETWPSQIL